MGGFADARGRRGPAFARVLVVGAGAAGVEVALALRRRLGPCAALGLLTRADAPLPRHAPAARRLAAQALAEAGVVLHAGVEAARVVPEAVLCAEKREFGCDAAVWAAGAAPVPWLRDAGLEPCPRGFLAVDAALRSINDPRVFAAGDCATVLPHPRERAGAAARCAKARRSPEISVAHWPARRRGRSGRSAATSR